MTLVAINYGNHEKVFLNADCQAAVFLSHLRKKCNIDKSTLDIDLTDENGNPQSLSTMLPNKFASNKLGARTEYILVHVYQEGKKTIVQPLLQNWKPIIRRQESGTNLRKFKS